MKSILVFAPLLLLAACASTSGTTGTIGTPNAAGASAEETAAANDARSQKIGEAITAPLSDFNLVQTPIPPVLQIAQNGPYAALPDPSCANIAAAVRALDAALGPDVDAPGHEHSLSEKGAVVVENAGISVLRSTTEGIVPFRGWIRKLTGAERHSEKVASAIGAGVVRRAYLKGVGQTNHCQAPAAPRIEPKPEADGKAASKS